MLFNIVVSHVCLPLFVVFDETETSVVANTPQNREQKHEYEPDDDVEQQILWYALVVLDNDALAAILIDLTTLGVNRRELCGVREFSGSGCVRGGYYVYNRSRKRRHCPFSVLFVQIRLLLKTKIFRAKTILLSFFLKFSSSLFLHKAKQKIRRQFSFSLLP